MSIRAVEWIVEHPLTRVELARVRRRVIEGVEHYIATRSSDEGDQVLGSWPNIATAGTGVLALYFEATGDHPYGDPDIPIRHMPQLALPGMPEPESYAPTHAVPKVHKKRSL